MKCIKIILTDEVKRLSDEIATRLVEGGTAKFCPKSEWKALRVHPEFAIVHTDEQKVEIQRKADKRKYSKDKKTFKPRNYMAEKGD